MEFNILSPRIFCIIYDYHIIALFFVSFVDLLNVFFSLPSFFPLLDSCYYLLHFFLSFLFLSLLFYLISLSHHFSSFSYLTSFLFLFFFFCFLRVLFFFPLFLLFSFLSFLAFSFFFFNSSSSFFSSRSPFCFFLFFLFSLSFLSISPLCPFLSSHASVVTLFPCPLFNFCLLLFLSFLSISSSLYCYSLPTLSFLSPEFAYRLAVVRGLNSHGGTLFLNNCPLCLELKVSQALALWRPRNMDGCPAPLGTDCMFLRTLAGLFASLVLQT